MASPSPPPSTPIPKCPNDLFHFDDQCVLVEDADEEIMELYMSLASTSPETTKLAIDDDSGGLGFLNSNESILEITIDLTSPPPFNVPVNGGSVNLKERGQKKKPPQNRSVDNVVVRVQQDLGMLKSQKGDTGSVLWRSSLHLSTQLLRQSTYPTSYPRPIFNSDILGKSSILELGSGTGLLAVLGSRLCGRYTSSDRLENLKLVKKNCEINGIVIEDGSVLVSNIEKDKGKENRLSKVKSSENRPGHGHSKMTTIPEIRPKVVLEEIDWIAISQERKSHPERWSSSLAEENPKYDLILAVDCIYNEYLVQPLIDTLAKYCKRGKGGGNVVWVVVELRSSDVLTLFLEKWLTDPSGPWTIVRLSEKMMGHWDDKKARWVGWVGWR
ncbi:hypothetical protein I203_107753 [Kwoniella mangroviensis CBS 8507]|uniref:hypothetical protein n=1 Tax=Kwoniella mangroviensis CBS 8507 TaxID=1296122 RepID=UPI00080CF238|nr:uncharacterized protein I203_08222 [Kwoniella mangroviensis CBS 8507]OCF62719.1 hypothetical protein I203_08222 [Kwoniella mangroviensis CBS 8507]